MYTWGGNIQSNLLKTCLLTFSLCLTSGSYSPTPTAGDENTLESVIQIPRTKSRSMLNSYPISKGAHDPHHHHFDQRREWCLPKLNSLIMSKVIMLTSHLKTSRCFAQIWPQRALGHPSSVGTLSFYQHCHSIRLKYHSCWQTVFLKHIKENQAVWISLNNL